MTMYNKNIKTHFDRNVFITFLVLLGAGFAFLSFKMNAKVDCSLTSFDIIADSYTIEDLIEFKSTANTDGKIIWDFGDKSATEFRSNVVHQFKKPGTYSITLETNGQCIATKEVVISKRRILISPELIPKINLPKNVRVGEEVTFSNNSSFATSWQWSFGETSRIDGTGKEEKYTFKRAGEKTILLVVNNDLRHESKQSITVLPKEKKAKIKRRKPISDPIEVQLDKIPDGPPEVKIVEAPKVVTVERIEISSNKMKQLIMGYSNREVDYTTIKKYLCFTGIPVYNSKGKKLRGGVNKLLQMVKGTKTQISNVELKTDSKKGCVTSITADIKIKKGLFWKSL